MPGSLPRVIGAVVGAVWLLVAGPALAYRDVRMTVVNGTDHPISVRWWDDGGESGLIPPPNVAILGTEVPGDRVAITGSVDVGSRWDLVALVGTPWKMAPWDPFYRFSEACVAARNPAVGLPRFAAGPYWVYQDPGLTNSWKQCSNDRSDGAIDTTLYEAMPPYPDFTTGGLSGEVRRGFDSAAYIEYSLVVRSTPAVPPLPIQTFLSGPGSVTANPTSAVASCEYGLCVGSAPPASMVTMLARAEQGARLTSWGGACRGSDDDCRFMASLRDDSPALTVRADFAPIPLRRLTVTTSGNGAGRVTGDPAPITCDAPAAPDAPGCSADALEGSSVTLRAVASPGSTFEGWTGPCIGTGDTCTVKMGDAVEVNAAFAVVAPPPTPTPPVPPAPPVNPIVTPVTPVVVPEPGPNPPDPAQPPSATRVPTISGLSVSRRAFSADRGTVVRYRLNDNARVTLAFTPRGRSKPAHVVRMRAGQMGGDAGVNAVRIVGRVGNRDVQLGGWTLRITARNARGTARPRATRLTVLPSRYP